MRQHYSISVVLAVALVALGLAGVAATEEMPTAKDLAESLRETEQAFAQTMADRDHAAFTSFLAEEAVFFGGGKEMRGEASIAAAWKGFFEGPTAPFSWQAETAAVLQSGSLGMTSGPVFDPDGVRIGTFNSVWRRGPDGSWKVVFDRGCPDCECPPSSDPPN